MQTPECASAAESNYTQKFHKYSPLSPEPIYTAIEPSRDWSATPRAQTRQEAEAMEQEKAARLKSRSLEGKQYFMQICGMKAC